MDDELLTVPDPALLGLPDQLPPLRLPDQSELARAARASDLLTRVRRLATWLGDRQVEVDEYDLSTADIAATAGMLGCSGDEAELLLSLADDLGFVELSEEDVQPGKGLDDWLDGSDEDIVDVWDTAMELVLTESAWYDPTLAPESEADLSAAGPAMMFGLFLAGGNGVPSDELTELVRIGLTEEEGDDDPLRVVGDPTPGLVARLTELGAVETHEGVVKLTPLALWGMRERYQSMGVVIPVLPPTEQMTAAELLTAATSFHEEEFAAESAAWLASRDPGRAGQELLDAAAVGHAAERMFAVELIRSHGLASEALWEAALQLPTMRPYAKTALSDHQMDITDIAWLVTDVLAAMGEIEAFPQAVPPGAEQEVFDVMWRLPHPEVADVLTMIGEEHPDKKIAKAARKAAFKAASR